MNQRVHVRLHRFAIRQNNFRCVGFHRTRLQTRQRLGNDLVRLNHLAHPHHVSGPNIAVVLDRDVKIVFLVAGVRIRSPDVQLDTAAAQGRAGAGDRWRPVAT